HRKSHSLCSYFYRHTHHLVAFPTRRSSDLLWSKDYEVSDWILKEQESRHNTSFIYDNHNSISIVTRESGKRFMDGQLKDYKKNTVLNINKVTGQIYNTLLF